MVVVMVVVIVVVVCVVVYGQEFNRQWACDRGGGTRRGVRGREARAKKEKIND